MQQLQKNATADDIVCILIAGHGFSGESGFNFVARNTGLAGTEMPRSISGADIFSHLNDLACPILLLIDACHSGGIESNFGFKAPGQLSLGPEIIASSQSRQLSFESPAVRKRQENWVGHGLFTAAGIEALSGVRLMSSQSSDRRMEPIPAQLLDSDENGAMSLSEFAVYVQQRVPELQDQLGLTSSGRNTQNPDILPSITFSSDSIRFDVSRN